MAAANYDFSNLVSSTLTVNKAHLTVTADAKTKLYGAALPTLTATVSGFVNGDTPNVVSGAPTLATTATASSHVQGNPYPILVSAGSLWASNYTFVFVGGTLIVTPAPLTIMANNAGMTQGTAVPPLSVRYSGFVNGDSPASLTTQPTLTTPASPLSPAGAYPIVVGDARTSDYAVNYTSGVLIVTPAPVRVLNVSIQAIRLGKTKKKTQVILLSFSGSLNVESAQNIGDYSLVTVSGSKKQKSKQISLSQATYEPAMNVVRLVTRKPLVFNPPIQLTVKAAGLLDTLGRPLDGDHDGQPGGNFVAMLATKE
jgi:hypothetical protein